MIEVEAPSVKESVYEKELLHCRVIVDTKLESYRGVDAYGRDSLIREMIGWFYVRLGSEKTITFEMDRPTFLDWLLRRKKTKTVSVRCRDILKDPPYDEKKHLRIYELQTTPGTWEACGPKT